MPLINCANDQPNQPEPMSTCANIHFEAMSGSSDQVGVISSQAHGGAHSSVDAPMLVATAEGTAGSDSNVPTQAEPRRSLLPELKNLARLVLPVAFFWLVNELGHKLATVLSLPLPGNLIGIALLLILLAVGAVKIEWIELGGSMLTRHMAFFFIPITVGLMGFGELFKANGLGIFVTLFLSASIGIVAAGLSVQAAQKMLKATQEKKNAHEAEKVQVKAFLPIIDAPAFEGIALDQSANEQHKDAQS